MTLGALWIPLALGACADDTSPEPSSAQGALDDRNPASDAGTGASSNERDPDACGGRCGDAETCCAGLCVDLLADVDHCGTCERVCAGQQAALACIDGACAIQQCQPGFVDCNGAPADGCERPDLGLPSAPRLVSPLQGEYTGSVHAQRSLAPRLRWSAPAISGTCGTLGYEVELDDSCARSALATCPFDSPELAARAITSTTWAPEEALPVRSEVPVGTEYAWHVRACESNARCSAWSEARSLNVGRLLDDLNGDGYSEVVALTRDGESTFRTLVVPGGAALAGATMVPFESPNDAFGEVRFVGDLNGDGFADALRAQALLALPSPVPDTAAFIAAALLLGAPVLSEMELVPLPERAQFLAAAALGDWDLDGFDDFAVAEATSTAEASATSGVRLYFGGTSLDLTRALSIAVPAATTPGAFGNELEGRFDLDADGQPDLAIMDGDDGRIHVVRGGPAAPRSVSLSLATGLPCNYFEGARLARAGDMTGDGVSELAARCGNRVLIYAGGRSPALEPIWQLVVGEAGSSYGADVAGGFDLGQDGLADFVFHTRDDDGLLTLMVLAGSTALGAASEPVVFGGNPGDAPLGDGVTIGDHDGDGRADVVVPVLGPLFDLRRFAGALVTPSGAACSQPSASFDKIGNWCDAASEDIADRYVAPAGDQRSVGDSFGFTLAR